MVALCIEERPLGRPHLAMTEVERQVAAKNHAALARNPVGEARRHLADPGNDRDAERDAAGAAAHGPEISTCRNMNPNRAGKAHAFGGGDLPETKDSRNPQQGRGASQAVP